MRVIMDNALNHIGFGKTKIVVYAKEINEDMDKLRNDYLVYIGDQKHMSCRDHKQYLIVFSKCDNTCTHHNLQYNTICRKRENMICSE